MTLAGSTLLALLAGCAGEGGSAPEPADPRPVLVLLTLDTLRGDHVGASTPFLAELAAEGLELRGVSTHTWTYAGIGTVLTGLHPASWGVESWTIDPDPSNMPYNLVPEIHTLAEALSAQGWATGYWTSNRVAGELGGLDRGYGTYVEYDEGSTPALVPEVVDWLDQHAAVPRFLHLHVNDPHSPHELHSDACAAEVAAVDDGTCRWDFVDDNDASLFANVSVLDGSFAPDSPDYAACRELLATAYRCEVVRQDEDLRAFWDGVAATGALDDALLVVVTDHGEGLLDPWTNHGFDLRRPVLDGWGLVRWPGRVEPGTSELPVAQEDVVPTVAELLDLDLGLPTDGFPVDQVPADRVRTTFYGGPPPGVGHWVHAWAAWDADRHYVYDSDGGCQLYDRVADRAEVENLCGAEEPPVQLRGAVDALRKQTEGYMALPAR